jgi:hypothetical protein
MKNYYLQTASGQLGPLTIEELKSKAITKNTPVWFDGLPDWTSAGQLDELKGLFESTPPPFQTVISKKQKAARIAAWQLLSLAAIVVLAIVCFQVYGQWRQQRMANGESVLPSIFTSEKEITKTNISTYVSVGHGNYQYYKLGGIKNLSIIVSNRSNFMLDHVKVKLSYVKADGGPLKDVIFDFTYVAAHTQQTLPVPDTERGTSVAEQIIAIQSTSLGL